MVEAHRKAQDRIAGKERANGNHGAVRRRELRDTIVWIPVTVEEPATNSLRF